MGFFDFLKNLFSKKDLSLDQIVKCPNCKKEFNLSLERCPHCGVHTDLMFRKKCPHCKAQNPLKAKKCIKCKKDLEEVNNSNISKVIYICPICNYRADFYMTFCPACGTKFV
ncbi:MAG: double zinc ribbon domain-containing protein [Candidatus Anstonellaceae archaeon]